MSSFRGGPRLSRSPAGAGRNIGRSVAAVVLAALVAALVASQATGTRSGSRALPSTTKTYKYDITVSGVSTGGDYRQDDPNVMYSGSLSSSWSMTFPALFTVDKTTQRVDLLDRSQGTTIAASAISGTGSGSITYSCNPGTSCTGSPTVCTYSNVLIAAPPASGLITPFNDPHAAYVSGSYPLYWYLAWTGGSFPCLKDGAVVSQKNPNTQDIAGSGSNTGCGIPVGIPVAKLGQAQVTVTKHYDSGVGDCHIGFGLAFYIGHADLTVSMKLVGAAKCSCRLSDRRTQSSTGDCPGQKLSADDVDGLILLLKENSERYATASKEKQKAKLSKLLDELKTIAKAEADKKLTADQKKTVLRNAAVELVGQLLGDKGSDIADQVNRAFDTAAKGATDAQKKSTLEKEIKSLVQTAAGSDKALKGQLGTLAEQATTLAELAFGKLTEKEQSAALSKAVTGLLERTVFDGLLNASYLKAATTGYELGAPLGKFIADTLGRALDRNLLLQAKLALNAKDDSWLADIANGSPKTITTTIKVSPFTDWQVTAYSQGDCKTVLVQIIGTDVGLFGFLTGKHFETYLVDGQTVENGG